MFGSKKHEFKSLLSQDSLMVVGLSQPILPSRIILHASSVHKSGSSGFVLMDERDLYD